DIETTGTQPGYHEMWQLSLLPLDSKLDISSTLKPFDLLIKPRYPDRIDRSFAHSKRLADAVATGIDSIAAFELFEHWFQGLNLLPNKRLVPLGTNLMFDLSFLYHWMGHLTYNEYFDSRIRDLMVTALFLNDRA